MSNMTSSPSPSVFPFGIDISESVDGLFYGYAISTVLFGITVVQAWTYININHDKWPLRLLVGALVFADLTTTCLGTQIMHHFFITNFGNLEVLTVVSTPLKMELLITIIIVFCVEIFFASRIWLLKACHWAVPALIVLCALGAAGAGITNVVSEFPHPALAYAVTESDPKFEIGFDAGLAAIADIVATTALCWSFSRAHNGIKKTDALLHKLFQYTVTRGLFVATDQTLFLIIFFIKPERLWWMPFHLSLSKVYVITMVAMLNSRDSLRKELGGTAIITDSASRLPTTLGVGSIGSTTYNGIVGRPTAIQQVSPFTVSSFHGSNARNSKSDQIEDLNNIELDSYKQRLPLQMA